MIYSLNTPRCIESKLGFKFYNISGDELFGIEETTRISYNLNPAHTSLQVEPCMSPITKSTQQYAHNMDDDKHVIVIPLSLSNSLFLEESLDQADLPTILEEDPKIQWNSDNQSKQRK